MKRKIFLSVLAGSLLLLNACKDFLDEDPKSYITPDQYLTDESQLAAYAIDRYSVFPTHGNWSFGTFGIDGGTDNMAAESYDNKYAPGQYRVPQKEGDWSFKDIYQCNYFLNTVVPRMKTNTLNGNAENIKHYIGEMYMIRAYVYFNKLQALGDFPIVKKILTDNHAELTAASKRAPRNEVARFIIQDLDSAITLMKTVAPDGKKNRLSKFCALLLKSRVALFEATWLKYFKNTAFVPNGPDWPGKSKDYNANYQYPSGSIDDEIAYFLDLAISSSKEVADATPLVSNNMVLQQSAAESVNPYFNMFSDADMSGYSEVLLWRRYDKGLGVTHNVQVYAMQGNYSNGLTRGMVEGFLMANGLPIYAAGSGYAGDDQISDVRKNRDGRLWLFLKEPGQKNVLFPNPAGDHSTPVELIPMIQISDVGRKYNTGYAIRKGLNYDEAHCGNGQGYTGAIVFRGAEAYLNYMEAYYERFGSLDAKAINYWKQIRTRASVDSDIDKTIAATDVSRESKNDWGAYSAGQTVDKTLYNIRRERRCELMAEGLRMMDLKRWRAMDQMISTPYHIEGFKLWGGTIQTWYKPDELKYGIGDASNVSAPSLSPYIRPYEKTPTSLVYNGYRWNMAHYLSPIAAQHFLITSSTGSDPANSPIYQNPGWSTTPNTSPVQ